MAVLTTVATGAGVVNGFLSAFNSGACGKKCRGFGKTLTKCRRKREENCRAEKAQKIEAEKQAIKEAQNFENAMAFQAPGSIQKSGFNPILGIGILGMIIAFFMGFSK